MSTINAGKKPRGRPRVDSEAVELRIEREILDAIDAYVARNPNVKSRQGAILLITESHLVEAGLLAEDTSRYSLRRFREDKGLSDGEFTQLLNRAAKRRRSPEPEPDPPSDPTTQPPLRPPKPPPKG